ncbi:rhamnogalacturonan lyase [Niastella caeni]|uniref:Rhamnogalacturonan lyase n=1 Tax=Niastella caeni TaxID=2569763 RepID=A0A4S8H8I3_9BACT|nr:rhamnogalacturonan lyase [Niastella caeni]THU31168.1 rhamnogalacturonan lyase [Niastella caeni]
MLRPYKILFLLLLMLPIATFSQRQMEFLNRGIVASPDGKGNMFVSWRLLATDKENIAFNLYRSANNAKAVKLNTTPITAVTSWLDEKTDSTQSYTYQVAAIVNGKEITDARICTVKAAAPGYISIPLRTPAGYTPNDASVGDLDGDGTYEIILHQAGKGHDNSHHGITDPPVFQAYTLDGTFLWQINLGKNIREGAHYTQFMVYDLDGDGKAEIAMKTADGTIDGQGKVIGDSTKDYRNKQGRILEGPEFLTIFDGQTGAAVFTTEYVPLRGRINGWGIGRTDNYGNRVDRFLACVAYLDGVHPSLVMCRGYYGRSVLAAWDYKDKKLTQRWVFDTEKGYPAFAGQGNHNLSVSDVDGDGRDEIVYGQMTVDDNGKGLYTTGIGHADALHVSDLDPERPGLEVFGTQERFGDAGANFRDAKTGDVIWKKPSIAAGEDGEGPGRALALDIDPRYKGYECWVAGAGITGLFDCKGNQIAEKTPACNMGIFWDGDVLSEILSGSFVGKWDYATSSTRKMFDARDFDCMHNNGTKANPCLSADILGDWREEIIYRTRDNQQLRIFTTTIPTTYKFYTLMQDPQYRLSIVWQNVAYNQPPHTGFYMGEGMNPPPHPSITIIEPRNNDNAKNK